MGCRLTPWPSTPDDLKLPSSRSQKFEFKYFLDPGHRTSASDISNHEKYNVRHNGGQIGNHKLAFDWHHDLWHWMTLNSPSSRSSKLHAKMSPNNSKMMTDTMDRLRVRLNVILLSLCFYICAMWVAHTKMLCFVGYKIMIITLDVSLLFCISRFVPRQM